VEKQVLGSGQTSFLGIHDRFLENQGQLVLQVLCLQLLCKDKKLL
jgi:hypothetical protein